MNNEKLLILLAVIASCTTVSWAHNKQSNRLQLRRIDVQRDEPRTSRNEDHRMVAEEEEEEEGYVPASFIFDYDPSNGNGASYHGHAIEMMAPVEVPEYDWRDDDSRGISELDRDGLAEGSQELLSAESDGQVQQCGDREIDPRHAVCCDGLVFRKIPGAGQDAGGKCCGRIAYDDRYFTCCQGRAIVRRSNDRLPLCCGDGHGAGAGDALPDQCRPGYQNNATGLGSTCCRSANPGAAGAWKCCIRGQGCCADERSTAIDVPGFRPACCHLANEDLTSQCCATTYEKIRVLPDCCSGDRLRPVCCKIRHSVNVRCCPGTVGYCCGVDERPGRATIYPPRVILETRHPIIHPQPVTDPPRPTHTDRLSRYPVFTYPPRPVYTTRLPYHPYPAIPPRTTQPPYPRYTTARGAPGYSTVRYSPGQVLEAGSPECCRSSYQQRSCCLRTRSPTCCSSSLPRCCFTLYFNITCCGSHMQQQQQQQQQGARNPQVYGGGGADREAEVRPLSETELRQTNERRQNQAQPPTNGHIPSHHHRHHQQQQPRHGGGVTLSCCRLETREATACCRNGYQESGRLPLCCVSSPGDTVEDIGDAPQSDAAATSRPRQHRNRTSSQRPHHQGQGHALYACNGVGFDADQFICCENILGKRVGFRPACCNSAVYDSYLYKCCKGKIRTSCGSGARPRKRHA